MERSLSINRTIRIVILFSIAMGFLEAAVVIYVRQIYYPDGFAFPLKPISDLVALTELFREAATVIMLVTIGILAGKTKYSRRAYFLLSFAVWDLVYYIVLKIILDWPSSLLTWDILFLIPVPWIGPVLCPCLVSSAMIALSFIILSKEKRKLDQQFSSKSIALILSGMMLILYTFMKDYFHQLNSNTNIFWIPGSRQKLFEVISTFIPVEFCWGIFLTGFILMLTGIIIYQRKRE